MKKNLLNLIIALFIAPAFAFSQAYCGSSRYDTEMFSTVTTTSNVVYGSNKDVNGTTQSLTMDIYQPTGDTAAIRPLIVFAHGGSFLGGSKTDADEVALCTRFAKRGYVTASIYYRLGMGFPIDKAHATAAVWRATQDMKAAVRFFRKDAATTNAYKIDSNVIFAGGYSAGCFMAVHLAYLDKSSEVPTTIDTVALGGLEGNSGNPGYSSKVNAVLNFAGAIADTSWIEAGDVPMMTAQGNVDNTVPYCTATIVVVGFPIMPVSGGGSINVRMKHLGITNPIHTYYGQDHCAPVGASGCPAANMDTSIWIASDFLYNYMGCTPTNSVVLTNQPTCVLTGVNDLASANGLTVYPVPSTDAVKVDLSDIHRDGISADLFDLSGRKVETYVSNEKEFVINRNGKEAGVYFLKVNFDAGKTQMAKIIWTK